MSVPFSNTHLRVPRGFSNILEALAREVLRDQPKDIPTYAAKYFESLLKEREESGMDHAQWGAKLEDRFYNNHAFKTAGPTEDITAVTSSSADDLIESQTEDETDITLPSGTTSGEMQGLDSEVRDDKEDGSNKDVTSTEAGFSQDDTDRRLTAAEESTDELSEAEQTSDPDDVTAENNDGRPAENDMLESQLEPTELASYRGVADVDVCAEELRETEKHVDGAPTSQCSTQDNQAAEVEGTGSSGGEKERRDGDRIEKVIFTEPSAVDAEEPSMSGEDGAPAGVIENVPTDETGTEVPVERSLPQMIEASQDPKQIPDFSGEEASESKTAVEEGTGVIPAAGIDPLCENEDRLNTAPDPEEVAIVSEHVEQGLPTEKQADEEEALTETSLTQFSEEKLHTFSLQAKHHGGFDTERWDEDLQADRAAEEVTADTGAVEVTARLEMEPDSNDDEDGVNEAKDQRKVESSTLHQLTNETEEIELWDDGDHENKDEAEHSSITDYAAAIEQGGPEDLGNVHMNADDDAAENNMDNFEKDSFNTQPQDDTETQRGNVAHIDADDDDGEQKELKTELEKEEEEEGQTAMEVNEEVPAESQERELTPVVEKAEEQTMEEEAGSKLEEKYFSQAGEAHTVEEEEEDQQGETKKAALEGDETVSSFGSVEQPGDDDSGEKDRPESKMEDVKEESSQPQEEEDIMDIPLDDPEANKAAAKIQAGFRGHMTRKKMKPEDKEGEEDEGAEESREDGGQ